MTEGITIDIKDVSIGYIHRRKKEIVCSGINLQARSGEIIALIGPNGVGKSTLLKTLVRFQNAMKGQVLMKSVPLGSIHREEFARLVSYVSTEPLRLPNITVNELVALGRFPYTNWLGTLTNEDLDIISGSISLVGIEHLVNKQIHEISDGERQRTMIARALAQDTEIIILDEPTAFLDLPNKYELVHLMTDLAHSKGKTIIFSTHDLNIAMAEVDKIWLMHHSKIFEGAPEDLILKHIFNNVFDERLNFDIQTGDFKSFRKNDKNIFIKPFDGVEYRWTVKAMERVGFRVTHHSSEMDPRLELEKNDKGIIWKLKLPETSGTFQDIYSLILFLKAVLLKP